MCVCCIGALWLWLMSEVLWLSEGQRRYCSDEHNICYEFYQQPKNRIQADGFCRQHHGILATISDDKTQQYIARLVAREGGEYWIGGHLNVLRRWTWVDSSHYPGQYAVPYEKIR